MADVEITPEVMRAALAENGRRASAARRRVAVKCEVCGTEFEGTVRARYCSDVCRAAAQYKAKKSELNTARVARRRAAASPSSGLAPAASAEAAPDAPAAELRELVAEGRELLAGVGARLAADASPGVAPAVLPAPSDPTGPESGIPEG